MKNLTIPRFVMGLRYKDSAAPTSEELSKRLRFLEKFPSQLTNIQSYQENPGCDCTKDIMAVIKADPRDKAETFSYVEGEPVQIITPVVMIGKVVTIDDTPEAWETLHRRIVDEAFVFRTINLVPRDGGKLSVFFS